MAREEVFNGLRKDQICGLVDAWIMGRNGERNRNILKLRLIDGLSFEVLAEMVDMSVSQTKRIVYGGIDRIFSMSANETQME